MRNVFGLFVAVLVVLAGVAMAADVKSGLKIGESVAPFDVKDCTGPSQGTTLCYRCQYGMRPVVAVFARRMSDDVTALVKQIDETVAKNGDKKMAAFVVYLSDEPDQSEGKLKAIAQKEKIAKTPLTVFQTGEGPESYKISKDADVTVMMWTGGKVKANQAFGKDKLSAADIKKVVADTVKILE